jgi:transcription antitermination factor NusG
MIKDKMWYAIYTKPRWEKKVAGMLTRKNIENYCPLNKVQRQWSDRKKIVMEPLFQSYVFVNVSSLEQTMVRETTGVLNFVYWLQKPAIIRDEEIEVIKRFLNEYHHVQIEKSTVNLNDKVRIIGGPLMMREGNVLEIKNKTVKVLLPTMGYTLVAEIEKTNLEKVAVSNDGSQLIVF